ncbi:MAG: right-handed parallel beta-helix repeat-containing protein [Blastocatellia bacterium]
MNKTRSILNILSVAVVCLICSSAAQAQATRTWASGVGDDANPCSRTAPCKTYAGCISKTAPGGEISTLDPGGFGGVTITKSITINGDGTLAGILASLVNGVIINANNNAATGDVIVLRNLSINGSGNGLSGIRYLAAKHVVVESCSISGFTQKGIDVSLGAAGGRLDVTNTTINRTADGVSGTNTAGIMNIAINRSRIQGTTNAGFNMLTGNTTVSDSVVTNNTSFGVIAQGSATITLERTVVAHNATGISTNAAGATVNMSNTTVNNNTAGITITAGTVRTFQNNTIAAGQGAANAMTTQQ